MFSRNSLQANNFSKTISYINIWCSHMCFSLQKNILKHKAISCISFFNCSSIYFLIFWFISIGKNIEVNINNVLIMTSNFNIRDSFWDPNYLYHFFHKDTLFEIANSFHVELSKPTEFFPTRYSNNSQDSNLVSDLVFLYSNSIEHNNHCIHPEWRLTSNHTSISFNISILKEWV